MGEQGDSVLRLRIGGDGRVQEASVAVSSGSARLDQAAMDHVRLRWRWRPACSNAMTEVTITWRLIDADAQDEAGR
jgi:TonB family protein